MNGPLHNVHTNLTFHVKNMMDITVTCRCIHVHVYVFCVPANLVVKKPTSLAQQSANCQTGLINLAMFTFSKGSL